VETITNSVSTNVKDTLQRRVDLINDPKEVLESLEVENFSFETLEDAFKKL